MEYETKQATNRTKQKQAQKRRQQRWFQKGGGGRRANWAKAGEVRGDERISASSNRWYLGRFPELSRSTVRSVENNPQMQPWVQHWKITATDKVLITLRL